MMPSNGSYVEWTTRAFGPVGGWMNGMISVFTNIFDLALYPLLIVSYIDDVLKFGEDWHRWVFVVLLVSAAVALNLAGVEAVGTASMIFFVLLYSPYVVETVIASSEGRVSPATWFHTRKDIQWRMLVNYLFWNWSGWDAMGSVAAEVKEPKRTYPVAVCGAVALTAFNYILPVAVGVSISRDYSKWDEGHFGEVARMVAPWLGTWVAISASVSLFGTFNSTLASYARTLWRVSKYGMLPETFAISLKTRSRAPVVATLFHAVLAVALCNLEFSVVLDVDNLMSGISLLIEKAAFLRLKWVEPDANRPYEVPGGKFGAVLVTTGPCCVIFFMMGIATWLTWAIAGGIIVTSAALYNVWRRGWLTYIAPSWGPLNRVDPIDIEYDHDD